MSKKTTLYILLILAALIGNSFNVFAQTKVWTGAVNNDWHNPGNWNPSGVPSSNNTVSLRGNTTPFPVITQDVTINSLSINDWWNTPGDQLFIDNGATLTLNGSLNIREEAALNILDGHLNMPSNSNAVIEGDFNITEGSSFINGKFNVNADGRVNNVNGDMTFNGGATIINHFDIGNGSATFNNTVTVRSGGRLYVDEGELIANNGIEVGNNGQAHIGSGYLYVNGNTNIASNALLDIDDGEGFIDGDVNYTGDGHLNINTGSLTITGDASVSGGGTIDVNSGDLEVGGDFEITGGSSTVADDGNITLGGDFTIAWGSDFDAGTSTFTFNGDGDQTINSPFNLDFHDVVIGPDSNVQTNVNGSTITINNNLEVEDGGAINVNGNDKLNVKGLVVGDDDVLSLDYPYAVTAALDPSLNFVELGFNLTMDPTSSTNLSNYVVKDRQSGQTLTVTGASLNTSGNNKIVTLQIAGIQPDRDYVVIMNNIKATNGKAVSPNHEKFFPLTPTQVILYSRKTGDWADNNSWSYQSHTGSPAGVNPESISNAIIIIGDGHTISVNNTSGSIVNHNQITVDSNSTLKIDSNTFDLGYKFVEGDGTFVVDSGHLIIGSENGISASGPTGNVRTGTRIFDANPGESSFTYIGITQQVIGSQITGSGLPTEVKNLTISNSNGVTASQDIIVNNNLNLESGNLIIKSGYSLVANNKNYTGNSNVEMQRTIEGSKGWRLFSTPVENTFGDFFNDLTTQGYTGSTLGVSDTLQPNVLWYKEDYPGTDNQRWRAPDNANESIENGKGLYTYVFGGVSGDNRYNDELPFTLSAIGREPDGNIDYGISYTAAADSGWNLVGNPYTASIDWDNSSGWTKTNVDQTIYIWDYDTNQYKTWNGSTGDLNSGLIAPFQGFWVKANSNAPKLEVKESAKTIGGSFVGKLSKEELTSAPSFSIILSDGSNAASTHFMFSDAGKINKDDYDAYRLLPPPGINSYIDLASLSEKGERYSINNLPRKFGMPIEIKLSVDVFDNGNSVDKDLRFSFENFKNIPESWTISLIDKKTNKEVFLRNGLNHPFQFNQKKGKTAPNGTEFGNKPKITYKEKAVDNRFYIRIIPGEDAADLPESYELKQNYPNPFNPSTKIEFSLPLQSYTDLSIYDMLGRKVATIINDELKAGDYAFEWNADALASGVYIYRLHTNNAVISKKMTLIK